MLTRFGKKGFVSVMFSPIMKADPRSGIRATPPPMYLQIISLLAWKPPVATTTPHFESMSRAPSVFETAMAPVQRSVADFLSSITFVFVMKVMFGCFFTSASIWEVSCAPPGFCGPSTTWPRTVAGHTSFTIFFHLMPQRFESPGFQKRVDKRQ